MTSTLKRTLTAGILAVGLTLGGAVAAAPASAAPKFETYNEPISVAKHVDHLIYKPASTKEFKGLGNNAGLATSYNIKLKHGKKVLYTKSHVNTWKVLYTDIKVYNLGDKTYKSDKAVVKKIRAASKVTTAHAKHYVKTWLRNHGWTEDTTTRLESETQAAVNSTVTTVQVSIVEGEPFTVGREDFDNGVYVVVAGDETHFTVTGYDPADNFTYTYDSDTGVFTVGAIS